VQSLDWGRLLDLDSPWAHLLVSTERVADDTASRDGAIGIAPVVRILRGVRCQDVDHLFQEWAAAFQFPYYFGNNWDAFEECIGDLSWLPAKGYVAVVTQAHLLLRQSDQALATLAEVFNGVAREWRMPSSPANRPLRPPTPFRVVFHAEPDHAAAATTRLQLAGVSINRSVAALDPLTVSPSGTR